MRERENKTNTEVKRYYVYSIFLLQCGRKCHSLCVNRNDEDELKAELPLSSFLGPAASSQLWARRVGSVAGCMKAVMSALRGCFMVL